MEGVPEQRLLRVQGEGNHQKCRGISVGGGRGYEDGVKGSRN